MGQGKGDIVARFTAAEVQALQKKVPEASLLIIGSYLYAKAKGTPDELEITDYPNGPSYVSLKKDEADVRAWLKVWEMKDGGIAIVHGEQAPPDGESCLDYLEDNSYRDTVALRAGHAQKLHSMHGDMSNQFSGPGRLGGMMSNISDKSQHVEALWRADKAAGCLGMLAIIFGASATALGLLDVLLLRLHGG